MMGYQAATITNVLGLGLLLLAILVDACPQGWTKDNLSSGCFYYIPHEAKFKDAQRACRHMYAELVVPKTLSDISGVQMYIQSLRDVTFWRNVWLDMKTTASNNPWLSSNGSAILKPIPWHEGYPEGDGDCGVLLYDPGRIKNKLCSLKSSVICRGKLGVVESVERRCPPLPVARIFTSVRPGTYAYLSCKKGFVLSSAGHKKTYCHKDGTWSKSGAELSTCQAESCKAVEVGEKVMELTSGGTDVGLVRNFTCPEGSVFKKQRDTVNLIIECHVSGRWLSETGSYVTTVDDCVQKVVEDGGNNDCGSACLAQHLVLAAAVMHLVISISRW